MVDVLQQIFNFYYCGGLWLALVPVPLFVFIAMGNQRRQFLLWTVFAFVLQAIGGSKTALNSVILGQETSQLYDGDCIRLGTVELTFFMQAGR